MQSQQNSRFIVSLYCLVVVLRPGRPEVRIPSGALKKAHCHVLLQCAFWFDVILASESLPAFREDDFVDKEEDQHQNVTVEHRSSDVIDKVRHQQARNRHPHTVDGVNEAGDQTECQHQAICLARSTSCAGSGIGFLFKAGKTVGFEPKTAAAILPV